MSLKAEASTHASKLEIHAAALKRHADKLTAGAEYARRLAEEARSFANLIPDPGEGEYVTATGRRLTEQDFEELADDAERYTLFPTGAKIARRDMNGKKLRSGDRVQVWNSERYGNPTGVVRGPGPDAGDGKERVLITLDSGQDDRYTPSTGRVERIERVVEPDSGTDVRDAVHALAEPHGPRIIIGVVHGDGPQDMPALARMFERAASRAAQN